MYKLCIHQYTYIYTYILISAGCPIAMSGHRSTVELLLSMETALAVSDVDVLLQDGKRRLQAWNEKYSERHPAADAEVRLAEPVPQVIMYGSVILICYYVLINTCVCVPTRTVRNSLTYICPMSYVITV